MGLSNLPPGVTDGMIPGNSPRDSQWEWVFDRLGHVMGDEGDKLSDETFERLTDFVLEHAEGLYDQGFRDGIRDEQQTQREALNHEQR